MLPKIIISSVKMTDHIEYEVNIEGSQKPEWCRTWDEVLRLVELVGARSYRFNN